MICKVCGSEFNVENFDICPYCMTPIAIEQTAIIDSNVPEKVDNEDLQECHNEPVDSIQEIGENFISSDLICFDEEIEITEADLMEEKDLDFQQ